MMSQRKNSQAAERFAERRRRENEAPRLRDRVPGLTGLRLDLEERTPTGGTKHIRRVVIDSAPALFCVACGDPRCPDGEHDLTPTIMQALLAGKPSFSGSDECNGSIGLGGVCSRVLHFVGTAEYRPGSIAAPSAFRSPW